MWAPVLLYSFFSVAIMRFPGHSAILPLNDHASVPRCAAGAGSRACRGHLLLRKTPMTPSVIGEIGVSLFKCLAMLFPAFYIKAENVQFLKFKYSFSVENTVREYINQILQCFIMAGIENKHGNFGITHWNNTLILVYL